jgi:hypothetical protein
MHRVHLHGQGVLIMGRDSRIESRTHG